MKISFLLRGTVSVISSYPPCKTDHARITTVTLIPLSNVKNIVALNHKN